MRTIFTFPSSTPTSFFALPSKHLGFFYLRNHPNPMPPSTKIVAEYAKSNRSSCKKCSNTIDSKTLRLGLVTRDARGFDITKWHHLGCFSFASESLASAQEIKGFDSLEVKSNWVFGFFRFCCVFMGEEVRE